MDAPWYAMTAAEQERMRGLSADLYALREGGPKRVPMSRQELSQWQDRARQPYAAFETGDLDGSHALGV